MNFDQSARIAMSCKNIYDDFDKSIGNISMEKMQSTIERLISDIRRREESINKASSVIEKIYGENEKLKSTLKRRNNIIEEQKKQMRELEESKMELRNKAREVNKYRTIESRLRGDLENLTREKHELERDLENAIRGGEMKVQQMQKDLEHEKLMKQKITNDLTEINKKEKGNVDLLESYVLEIREHENDADMMKKEILSLKQTRNSLIEQHAKEIKSIQENARRTINRIKEASKTSHIEGNQRGSIQIQEEKQSIWNIKYKLMAEIAAEAVQTLHQFSSNIGEISTNQNDDLEVVKRRLTDCYEKEVAFLDSPQDDFDLKYNIEEFERRISEYEEVVSEQQSIIKNMEKERKKLLDLFKDAFLKLEKSTMDEISLQSQSLEKLGIFMKSRERNYESVSLEANRKFDEMKDKLSELKIENKEIMEIIVKEVGISYKEGDSPILDQLKKGFEQMKEKEKEKYQTLKKENQEIAQENLKKAVEANKTNEDLKQRIDNLQEEIRGKNKEIDELHEILSEQIKDANIHKDEYTELGEQLIRKSEEVELFQEKFEELQTQNQKLIQQVNKLSKRNINDAMSSHNSRASQDFRSLRCENKHLQNRILNLEYELEDRQIEIDALKQEIDTRKDRMSLMVKDLDDSKANLELLEEKNYMLAQENKNLKSSILNCSVDVTSKHDQSIPELSAQIGNTSRITLDLRNNHYDDDDEDLDDFQKEFMQAEFD